ncbi:MAG: PTS sugar transporter subunit IIB [Lachnospiraceae bacterium]|nr:PTS sugar transporter subunit IIB [Lachnospiraceae bacterium]
MLTIRLFCNAGMSTSLLVEKMVSAAEEEGLEVDIRAYPANEMDGIVDGIDCALLGPQVGYMKAQAKKICDKHGVPVDVIPMQDYGMCNGKNVLAFAKKLIGK